MCVRGLADGEIFVSITNTLFLNSSGGVCVGAECARTDTWGLLKASVIVPLKLFTILKKNQRENNSVSVQLHVL